MTILTSWLFSIHVNLMLVLPTMQRGHHVEESGVLVSFNTSESNILLFKHLALEDTKLTSISSDCKFCSGAAAKGYKALLLTSAKGIMSSFGRLFVI